MNSFFGDDEERDDCAWSLVDILYKALLNRGLLARKPDTPKWRREFRAALDQGLVQSSEVEVTLVWYVNNMTRSYMPQAYSAKGFLDRYPAIRQKFLDERAKLGDPAAPKPRMREESSAVGLVPPPEGANDDLVDWYDKLVEEGESYPDEISRYAEECELRSSTNR
mgnify:CR=1 FL=1